jgi:large subunit ribosomal protein L10
MKLAVEGISGTQGLAPHFKEQVGLVFASDEFTSVAKVLSEFSDKNKALSLVGGCLESDQIIDRAGILKIATLPSKDVLLGQVCATLNAPIAGLAIALNMTMLKLVWSLKKLSDQKK